MKKLLILFLLITATCIAADQVGPEPAPWWERVEQTEKMVMQWLAALTVIGGGVTAFVLYILGRVNTIKEQIRQQAQVHADAEKAQNDRLNAHSDRITSIAIAAVPVQSSPPATPK